MTPEWVHIYQGDVPFDQLDIPAPEPGVEEDYHWASTDLQVQREYGGRVVAVYQKKVLGAGWTALEAIAEAEKNPDCPPSERLVLVHVSYLPRQ